MLPRSIAYVFVALVCVGIRADYSCDDENNQCENEDDLAVHLLQRRTGSPQRAGVESAMASGLDELGGRFPINTSIAETPMCTPLLDEGSSFTVLVQLGTATSGKPPQSLSLIVDTGSNAMVVNSCFCNLASPGSGCELYQPCFFDDPSVSPTFKMSTLMGVELDYGSGAIECGVGTDYATFAATNISAYMQDGLYLVRDRHELSVGKDFRGIVGLGIPPAPHGLARELFTQKLFMEAAGVPRYSICFNSGGIPGALKTGMPPLQTTLTSIGVHHWGLGVNGLRAGSTSSRVITCSADMEGAGTETPCGMVPDSGTTQILGPPDQVVALLAGLCAEWPRCVRMAESAGLSPSADLFTFVLSQCKDWLTPENGIHEVPSIFMDLMGANDGEAQTIELTAWSWVVEVESTQELSHRSSPTRSMVERYEVNSTAHSSPICVADIDTTVYPTLKNGPVWILGEALFFQGTVSYDITTYPPKMGFDMDVRCNCPPPGVPALLDEGVEQQKDSKLGRTLRKTRGKPRVPKLNTSTPL